jgi:hypothetical protein
MMAAFDLSGDVWTTLSVAPLAISAYALIASDRRIYAY